MTFRTSTRPKEEVSRLQRLDPDIGPILAAKVSSKAIQPGDGQMQSSYQTLLDPMGFP